MHVHIERCKCYDGPTAAKAISACLESFGGASALAKRGTRVLIKPNLVLGIAPERAATTHPVLVEELARQFVACGAEVTIADSCGGIYSENVLHNLYRVTGMTEAAERSGAQLNFDTSWHAAENKDAKYCGRFHIIEPVFTHDLIISFAKLKTHAFARYTGAVKNLYGCMPGTVKAQYHSRFPNRERFGRSLVDLCECIRPGFSIIDGVIGMEGKGPTSGESKYAGVLIASDSPYAADLAGAEIMDMKPRSVFSIDESIQRGYVPESTAELYITGCRIADVRTHFKQPPADTQLGILNLMPAWFVRAASRHIVPFPHIIKDICIGCGDCVRACPEKVITIRDKKAHIGYEGCIQCYCCHELCKIKAVKLKRGRGK